MLRSVGIKTSWYVVGILSSYKMLSTAKSMKSYDLEKQD